MKNGFLIVSTNPQNTFSFEVYINSPCDTDVPELITDIYIPVLKKKIFTDIK